MVYMNIRKAGSVAFLVIIIMSTLLASSIIIFQAAHYLVEYSLYKRTLVRYNRIAVDSLYLTLENSIKALRKKEGVATTYTYVWPLEKSIQVQSNVMYDTIVIQLMKHNKIVYVVQSDYEVIDSAHIKIMNVRY